LDWLRPKISREMIEEISRNDYGREIEQHSAAVVAELNGEGARAIPAWYPREVLELERWREPDQSFEDAPPTGERGHLKRLLACSILLRDAAFVDAGGAGRFEEEFFVEASADSVLQLTRSTLTLDKELPALTTGFLLWLFDLQKHPALRPYVAFALLCLAVVANAADADIFELCDWVVAVEAICRATIEADEWAPPPSAAWLPGVNTYLDHEGGQNNCQRLAGETLHRLGQLSPTAQDRLSEIFDRLT
jgi:hypothetical protein